MSLYQKYRPDNFSLVKGNADILSTLERMLTNLEEFPHALLFFGDTGCGKTTLARIIASKLGCKGDDLKEIDNAAFRGIDSVRDMKVSAQYAPMEGRCKVYILDEIGKMLGDAQNALLKELEEIRPHVYYILCTTEPQKLLATIRGRCSQFQVKPLTDSQMKGLLRGIVRSEKQTLDDEVYDQIIQDSLGHPRNAITILEQVLNADPERRLAIAQQTAAQQSQGIELCRLLMSKSTKWTAIASILVGLKDQEPESIRRIVLGYAQAVLLKSDNPRCGLILECFMDPNFTNGFPQLVFSSYQVCKG